MAYEMIAYSDLDSNQEKQNQEKKQVQERGKFSEEVASSFSQSQSSSHNISLASIRDLEISRPKKTDGEQRIFPQALTEVQFSTEMYGLN